MKKKTLNKKMPINFKTLNFCYSLQFLSLRPLVVPADSMGEQSYHVFFAAFYMFYVYVHLVDTRAICRSLHLTDFPHWLFAYFFYLFFNYLHRCFYFLLCVFALSLPHFIIFLQLIMIV